MVNTSLRDTQGCEGRDGPRRWVEYAPKEGRSAQPAGASLRCTGTTSRCGQSTTRDDASPCQVPAHLFNIILLKSRGTTMDRWLDVSAAPRDGTPVILWIDDDEAPPAFLVTVGAWEEDSIAGQLTFIRKSRDE